MPQAKKQTQFKANKANSNPIKAKTNPIQTQFVERPKMMQSVYLQTIMKKMWIWAIKKQIQSVVFSPYRLWCFPATERRDFSKNSGILQLAKMGPFCSGSAIEVKQFIFLSRTGILCQGIAHKARACL